MKNKNYVNLKNMQNFIIYAPFNPFYMKKTNFLNWFINKSQGWKIRNFNIWNLVFLAPFGWLYLRNHKRLRNAPTYHSKVPKQ